MRYSSLIRNQKALEWELSLQEAYLFSWMYELPSWAEKVVIGSDVYYFASKNKAIEEMPLLTTKADTMYRYYKSLEAKELILIKKIDGKDYISLTTKSKTWNFQSDYSENNPTLLGNKSEYYSENNPTYNNTNFNKTTNNNNIENLQFSESEKDISLTDLKKGKEKSFAKKESEPVEVIPHPSDHTKEYGTWIETHGDGELHNLLASFYNQNPTKYEGAMYSGFKAYWTALVINGKDKGKELWRTQKTFSVAGRLATWATKYKPQTNGNNNNETRQLDAINKAKEAMAIVRERDRIRNGYSATE